MIIAKSISSKRIKIVIIAIKKNAVFYYLKTKQRRSVMQRFNINFFNSKFAANRNKFIDYINFFLKRYFLFPQNGNINITRFFGEIFDKRTVQNHQPQIISFG